MSEFISAMTESNMAYLGILDELFDLYNCICDVFEAEYKKTGKELGELNTYDFSVEQCVKRQYRKLFEDFFKKYSYLFIDPPGRIHASAWLFESYSIIHIEVKDPLIFKARFESFGSFLRNIQELALRFILRQERKQKPLCDRDDVKKKINDHIWAEVTKAVDKIRIPISSNVDLSEQPLYIFDSLSSTSCSRNNHPVLAAPFYANKIDGTGVIALPTHYCSLCDKYLIGRITLNLYDKSFGKVLVERRNADEDEDFSSFQLESRLHQFGYNVIDGELSESERQNLLLSLLQNKKMDYFSICKTIEQNIVLFRSNPKFQLAILKWRRDLKFLGDYILEHPELK